MEEHCCYTLMQKCTFKSTHAEFFKWIYSFSILDQCIFASAWNVFRLITLPANHCRLILIRLAPFNDIAPCSSSQIWVNKPFRHTPFWNEQQCLCCKPGKTVHKGSIKNREKKNEHENRAGHCFLGPRLLNLFWSSTQLRMKFVQLIKKWIPAI